MWKALENLTIDGQRVPYFLPRCGSMRRAMSPMDLPRTTATMRSPNSPLDGTGKGRLVLARSDVDVDSLIRIGSPAAGGGRKLRH